MSLCPVVAGPALTEHKVIRPENLPERSRPARKTSFKYCPRPVTLLNSSLHHEKNLRWRPLNQIRDILKLKFCQHYSPHNTFTKIRERSGDPDPYLGQTDPAGPKTYGSETLQVTERLYGTAFVKPGGRNLYAVPRNR